MNQTPSSPKPFPPYHPMLKESINRFLTEYQKGATNFHDFTSIFSRTLHTTPDPPIPLLWFFSSLEFHSNRFETEPSRTKGLFQLLVSCSGGCGNMKKIGVLAPLIFVLYRLAVKKEGNGELQGLVEWVVSYCSILCGSEVRREDDEVAISEDDFVDLVKVWMVDCEFRVGVCVESFLFFPFVSDGFRKEVIDRGCEVGFLAGVVMFEALLLKLCLSFDAGISRAEQEKKLQACAVQTIPGFRNFYFLDTLLRMMLEPVLPVISLLGSENEVLLKEVLYNSVMVMDYSFILSQAGISLYANSLKDFAITWLFVAELAVQSIREDGDQEKAISYVNAFCRSCIPIQLINWVMSQSTIGRKISRPNVSTPIALIKWLLVAEEQGFAIFGDEASKHRAKALVFTSRSESSLPAIKHLFNSMDKNCCLSSIHGGTEADRVDGNDIEMLDTVDDRMNTATADGTRKRKDGIEDDNKAQLKYTRCQFHENSVRENSFIFRQQ